MISGAAMAEEPQVVATPEPAPVVTEATEEQPATIVKETPASEVTAEKSAPVTTLPNAEATVSEPAVEPKESALTALVPEPAVEPKESALTALVPEPVVEPKEPALTALVSEPAVEPKEPALTAFSLDSEEQKRAYATGVMMADYIEEQIAQQKTLHFTLDKNIMLAGITDSFNGEGKMNAKDVQETLAAFNEQITILTQAQNDKKLSEDKAFVNDFAKRPGVKKTSKGLYYLIEEKGDGPAIKDANQVEIAYKGEMIDGTIIDGPQVENANQIFHVANMPPILRDSVKLLRKGGRIKIVIPPTVVANTKGTNKPNIVVIYTISVVNVNKP